MNYLVNTHLSALRDMLPRLTNYISQKWGTYIRLVISAALWNIWTKRSWLKRSNRLWAPFQADFTFGRECTKTHLQSREPLMLRWLTLIQNWSAELKTGLVGRGAGKSRKASSSRPTVGVVGWLLGQENVPSECSAPGSCPVDTIVHTRENSTFKVLFLSDSYVAMKTIKRLL